nr:MFS transporter [Staphylococcus caeli]
MKGALLFSAVIAGLILLPVNAVNLVLSPIVGSLFDRFGARYFGIIGYLLMFIAALTFALTITAHTHVWLIILLFMVLFFGITMVMMPAQTNELNQLPHDLYADGSATITTLIQVGGSAGTAIAITIYTTAMKSFGAAHPSASQEVVLAHGVQFTFIFIIILTVIGWLLSLFVSKSPQT